MWPWEHLAVGYVLYSALVHATTRRRPAGGAVVVLVVATQLPDLVDKPLAWAFDVLPSGTSLAHSLLVAVPVTLLAVALARRAGRQRYGWAFAVGYLSHLPGDVLYPALVGGTPKTAFLLWPVVPAPPGDVAGVLPHFEALVAAFLAHLATPHGAAYLAGEAALVLGALALWVYDGTPGLGWLRVRRRGGRRHAPPDE